MTQRQNDKSSVRAATPRSARCRRWSTTDSVRATSAPTTHIDLQSAQCIWQQRESETLNLGNDNNKQTTQLVVNARLQLCAQSSGERRPMPTQALQTDRAQRVARQTASTTPMMTMLTTMMTRQMRSQPSTMTTTCERAASSSTPTMPRCRWRLKELS